MADFTILVQNKSGTSRAYAMYMQAPQVTGPGASALFQSIYLTARPVPNNTGTASFKIHRDYYAVTGTAPQPLGANVNVSTGDYELVTLASGGDKGSSTYMTVDEGGAHFQPEKITASITQPGGFCITTDKSFNFPNSDNYFIGLGAQNPDDPSHVIPVALFPAQPNTKNIITACNVYYICWGQHSRGDVIDVSTISEPVKVDFSNTRSTKAKVVHKDDGSWVVTYN